MNEGCCAAGRGTTTPRTAVRPTASATARTTAATTSVSASVASPRTDLFTLKPFISLYTSGFYAGCWLVVVGLSAVGCSAIAPQAPGDFCISPWGVHARFALLAQPHLLPVHTTGVNRGPAGQRLAARSMVASEPLARRHTASSKNRKNQAKTLKMFAGNCFLW